MSPAGAGFSHPRNVLTVSVLVCPPHQRSRALLRRTEDLCPSTDSDLNVCDCVCCGKLCFWSQPTPSFLREPGVPVSLSFTQVQFRGHPGCGSSEKSKGLEEEEGPTAACSGLEEIAAGSCFPAEGNGP